MYRSTYTIKISAETSRGPGPDSKPANVFIGKEMTDESLIYLRYTLLRPMTMSPLYPCSKACSNREKLGPIFFNHQWNYDGITASNLNPVGVFSMLQPNRKFYHIYTVTIVIHKSHNLIGTVGIAKFEPE